MELYIYRLFNKTITMVALDGYKYLGDTPVVRGDHGNLIPADEKDHIMVKYSRSVFPPIYRYDKITEKVFNIMVKSLSAFIEYVYIDYTKPISFGNLMCIREIIVTSGSLEGISLVDDDRTIPLVYKVDKYVPFPPSNITILQFDKSIKFSGFLRITMM